MTDTSMTDTLMMEYEAARRRLHLHQDLTIQATLDITRELLTGYWDSVVVNVDDKTKMTTIYAWANNPRVVMPKLIT